MYFDFRLCNDVSTKQNNNNKNVTQAESIRVVPRSPLKRDLISHPTLQGMAFLFTIMFFCLFHWKLGYFMYFKCVAKFLMSYTTYWCILCYTINLEQ